MSRKTKRKKKSEIKYRKSIADDICARLSAGEPLREICSSSDMPPVERVYEWAGSNKTFQKRFHQAITGDGPRAEGRPSVFKDTFIEQAYRHCLLGATNEDLAGLFNVDTSTIDDWIANKPEFSGAIKKGKCEADAKVAESLFKKACGYSHQDTQFFSYKGEVITEEYTKHYPPDTGAAFIWLKNRQKDKWRDRTQKEISGPDGGPIETEQAQPVLNVTINSD